MFAGMMAMLLGIVCASFLPISAGALASSASLFIPAIVTGSLLLVLGFFSRPLVTVSAVAFLSGVLVAIYSAYSTQQSLLLVEHEQELTEIEGVITGLPQHEYRYGKRVQRFEMDLSRTRWRISEKPMRRVKLSWASTQPLKAGEHWRLRAKLKRPRGFANPGAMDYQLYLHQQKIDATGYVRWGQRIAPPQGLHWHGKLSQLRERLGDKLAEQTAERHSSRFIRALAIGDGAALSGEDWQVLSSTGTTHLFVISGLHIGLLAALSYGLALLLCRCAVVLSPTLNAHHWAAGISLLSATSYAALAGFSLPTQRAVFMLLAFVLAHQLGRKFGFAKVWLLVALLLAIWQPLAVRSAGYCLSLLAVAGLLFAHSHRLSPLRSKVLASIKLQLVCALALLAPLLLFFQSVSWLMPLVNLLVVPVVSLVVVPLVLLVLLLSAFSVATPAFILSFLDLLLIGVWQLLLYCASLATQGAMSYVAPKAIQLLAVGLLTVCVLAPAAVRKPLRLLLPLCCVPWLALSNVPLHSSVKRDHCPVARFAVLDVGQGLASVFSAMGRTLVFDTGARFSPSFDAGRSVVAPYLRARGHSSVDTLVVSHQDLDHAGGLASLQELMPIEQLFTSYELTNKQHQRCRAGVRWRWGGIEFEFLSPLTGQSYARKARNNGSCVLMISSAGFRLLLPGDIETEAEQELLERLGSKLRADILVMPHHGSASSSSELFLAAVQPKYAIASAAYKGRFKHPNEKVLDRYREIGATTLTTASQGAIEFQLATCRQEISAVPSAYRQRWGNYWLAW